MDHCSVVYVHNECFSLPLPTPVQENLLHRTHFLCVNVFAESCQVMWEGDGECGSCLREGLGFGSVESIYSAGARRV